MHYRKDEFSRKQALFFFRTDMAAVKSDTLFLSHCIEKCQGIEIANLKKQRQTELIRRIMMHRGRLKNNHLKGCWVSI